MVSFFNRNYKIYAYKNIFHELILPLFFKDICIFKIFNTMPKIYKIQFYKNIKCNLSANIKPEKQVYSDHIFNYLRKWIKIFSYSVNIK